MVTLCPPVLGRVLGDTEGLTFLYAVEIAVGIGHEAGVAGITAVLVDLQLPVLVSVEHVYEEGGLTKLPLEPAV